MRMQKFSRPGVILMATVVALITSIVVANATQTITTPNAAFISYNLASGATSAAITPAASKPVLVMGCCTTEGGVGHVSLLRLPGALIEWVGLEGFSGPSTTTTTAGGTKMPGTHIVWINFDHDVDIQVASADTIQIHNSFGSTLAGNVTLIW
jgi:hypothetical protein